jgi:hypothetical protein
LQTNATTALVTFLVAGAAGTDAVAGFGTAPRLEYLLVPLAFGLGALLVARVVTNMGAGQQARALRIAMIGGCIAFVLTEAVGVVASIWPGAWLALFSAKPSLIKTSSEYVRMIWPAYGFFGLGIALYFRRKVRGACSGSRPMASCAWPWQWEAADGIAALAVRRRGTGPVAVRPHPFHRHARACGSAARSGPALHQIVRKDANPVQAGEEADEAEATSAGEARR